MFGIVHEDDELLAVNKPADLVCHPTKGDEYSSLISRVRLHLGQAAAHMINRLDRETTGVVLFAKRDEAAKELRKLWVNGTVKKSYEAIVHGHVEPDSGLIDQPLGPDDASPVAIKDCVRPDGRTAQREHNRPPPGGAGHFPPALAGGMASFARGNTETGGCSIRSTPVFP